ncbi:MAG: hypothetical protein ACK4M1_11145 [Flavobacterium sp.]
MTDYHPYVAEQKHGNDFLKDINYSVRREKLVIENRRFLFIENDVADDFIKLRKASAKYVTYNFNEIFSLKIPFELRYLESAYQKAEYIIHLEDDWNDEGALKYNFEVWKKALNFVNEYATTILIDFNKKIESPKIYHGPKGSIDILIENEKYSLLINVIADTEKAIYFGKDGFGNISKGEINISKINGALIPIAFNF